MRSLGELQRLEKPASTDPAKFTWGTWRPNELVGLSDERGRLSKDRAEAVKTRLAQIAPQPPHRSPAENLAEADWRGCTVIARIAGVLLCEPTGGGRWNRIDTASRDHAETCSTGGPARTNDEMSEPVSEAMSERGRTIERVADLLADRLADDGRDLGRVDRRLERGLGLGQLSQTFALLLLEGGASVPARVSDERKGGATHVFNDGLAFSISTS